MVEGFQDRAHNRLSTTQITVGKCSEHVTFLAMTIIIVLGVKFVM